MDAIAPIALLLSHQSGYLNHAVDTILPVYPLPLRPHSFPPCFLPSSF
jgi:hypothetical protein